MPHHKIFDLVRSQGSLRGLAEKCSPYRCDLGDSSEPARPEGFKRAEN